MEVNIARKLTRLAMAMLGPRFPRGPMTATGADCGKAPSLNYIEIVDVSGASG